MACGWNLTVALTRDGHVFQMGSTGAYNAEEEKGGRPPAWEGCKAPTQVDGALFGLYIEEVRTRALARDAWKTGNGRAQRAHVTNLVTFGHAGRSMPVMTGG